MKMLSKKQVKELVLYSFAHTARLEKMGRFPQRVRLGNGPRCRVGWLESEIHDWLRERVTQRSTQTP